MTEQTVKVLRALLQEPTKARWGRDLANETGLKSGSLHPILARLEQAGLIAGEWENTADVDPGRPRRRYYAFTTNGAETARLAIAEASAAKPRAAQSIRKLRPQAGC